MSAKNPEISVIVPVYNAGEYLAPCIESVLAQTWADFELLLVDDASTDGSLALCRSYAAADSRVRVLPQAVNRGVSMARNCGIDAAAGTYLTFLDADDSLHPQFLQVLREACLTRECKLAVSGFEPVSPQRHLIPPTAFPQDYSDRAAKTYSAEEAVAMVLYQTVIGSTTWAMLYHRELFDSYRFRPIRYEDLDSFYRLFLSAGRIAYVPAPMYFYTMNPGSYMHTFSPERAVVLDVTERIVDFMQAGYPQLLPAAQDRALSAAFNIFNLLAEHRCDEPEIADRCKRTIRRYRRRSLFNRRVRLKNKIGIMVTYLGGFRLLELMARFKKNK